MEVLVPGTIVEGRYRVVRRVGRGGMGAVYEATDLRLGCAVALKQMANPGADASSAFEHEARLLAALRHPVLPVVSDHFTSDEGQFLVMQFIPGDDLAAALRKRQRPFAVAEILPWLDPLFDALRYLHSHEPPILHRDIKPANLKLTPEGRVVLLDFGLAKGDPAPGGGTPMLSVAGYTPCYAPMEQIECSGTDARADVYGLGATLYNLLTNTAPPNAVERAAQIYHGDRDPLHDASEVATGVPPAVGEVLARAMALRREDRFRGIPEMRAAFLSAATGDQVTAVRSRRHASPRRVDAAAPAQAVVGAQIDLLVQVRFPDSPRLGLEDWPRPKKPDAIEQAADAVSLSFPRDAVTGELRPARVRVKVVSRDFRVEGDVERVMDVPPDAYSPRVAFLLTALWPGSCRVNVEVYSADAAYLGAASIETEVGGEAAADAQWRVSSLVLQVIAREVAASLSPQLPTLQAPAADVILARPVPPATVSSAPTRRAATRWARFLAPAATVAVVATAGALYVASMYRPLPEAAAGAISPPAAAVPDSAAAPAPSSAAPAPSSAAAAPPAAEGAAVSDRPAGRAAPPPAASGQLPAPAPAAQAPAAPAVPARGRPAEQAEGGSANVTSVSDPMLWARLRIVPAPSGATRFFFEFHNRGSERVRVAVDWRASFVADAERRRRSLLHPSQVTVRPVFVRDVPPDEGARFALEVPMAVRAGDVLTVVLACPDSYPDAPRFDPIVVTVR